MIAPNYRAGYCKATGESVYHRFWGRVELSALTGCWEWTGALDRGGYGRFKLGGQMYGAHRFSYELCHGQALRGRGDRRTCVCHVCDNRRCVRPDHLFVGTIQDNMDDKVRKGRQVGFPGSRNPQARLSEHQVQQIRSLFGAGRSYIELAARFGVSEGAVRSVVARRTWAHVREALAPRQQAEREGESDGE